MLMLAKIIILIFAVWLLAVSLMMLFKPALMLKGLGKMASTTLINYIELSLRLIVGVAFYYFALISQGPSVMKIAGLFLIITSLILMIIPRRWHHGYSVWWAGRLKFWMVRLATPFSFVVGIAIIFSVT